MTVVHFLATHLLQQTDGPFLFWPDYSFFILFGKNPRQPALPISHVFLPGSLLLPRCLFIKKKRIS